MKALFLDIDGVVNSSRSVLARSGPAMTPATTVAAITLRDKLSYTQRQVLETTDVVAIALVNRLIRESKAVLVLSTSHRAAFTETTPFGSPQHLHYLNLFVQAMGIESFVYGVTPKLHLQRGDEVARWMEENPTTHAVILDDGKDFHPFQNLVWCNPDVGFNHTNYYAASRLFGMSENHE
jgi:hypothetical protein